MRRTVSSCPAICSPIRKKVALAPRSARPSSSCSVVSGHGPSSKVSATYFSGIAAGSAAEAGRLLRTRRKRQRRYGEHTQQRPPLFPCHSIAPRRSLCARRRLSLRDGPRIILFPPMHCGVQQRAFCAARKTGVSDHAAEKHKVLLYGFAICHTKGLFTYAVMLRPAR